MGNDRIIFDRPAKKVSVVDPSLLNASTLAEMSVPSDQTEDIRSSAKPVTAKKKVLADPDEESDWIAPVGRASELVNTVLRGDKQPSKEGEILAIAPVDEKVGWMKKAIGKIGGPKPPQKGGDEEGTSAEEA